MVHLLSAEVWERQPRWFSEGWAEFLEPIYYAENQKEVVVGAINYEALAWYRSVRTTKLTDALVWNERVTRLAEREMKGLYGISWLFVHWLFHQHPAKLDRFIAELGRGTAPERALELAFPNFDPDATDRELFQYQKYFRFARFDQNVRPLIETPVSESSLADRVLDPREVANIENLLAAVGDAYAGRSPRHDRSTDIDRPRDELAGPDYAALPMLPQYPCRPEDVPRGRLPPEVTERVIRGADQDLRACYNEGLTRNAYLGGKVTMRFVVDEDGNVGDLRTVCTSLPDAKVVSCMAERFAKFQFAKRPGSRLTVVFPITFDPGD
jgi:hypothetical protein